MEGSFLNPHNSFEQKSQICLVFEKRKKSKLSVNYKPPPAGEIHLHKYHLSKNLRFGRLVFEKRKKKSKISVNYSPLTFSNAVDERLKQKRPGWYAVTQGCRLSYYGYPFFENQ